MNLMNCVRVCILTGDSKGGIRHHIHAIVTGLASRFEFSYIFGLSSFEEPKFTQDLRHIELLLEGRIASYQIDKPPNPKDIANIFRIIRQIKIWRCQLLHGHGAKGGLYARIAGAMTGIPVIYTPHGGALHDIYGRLGNTVYVNVEKLLARYTDVVIFESEYSAAQFGKKIGYVEGLRTVINPNAIRFGDADRSKLKKSDGRILFGVFGILRKIKGQRVVMEAFRLASSAVPDGMELHYFGDGEDRLYLLQMAIDLGLEDSVFFHGAVSDVEEQMARMDAIVIPSLAESFCYVALEAVTAQRFVIGSSVGVLPQLFSSSTLGRLVSPGDIKELADAMIDYCRAPIYPPKVSGEIRQTYSYERFLEQTLSTYITCACKH